MSPTPLASPAVIAPAPAPTRRALPAPLDPIFPSADFLGPTIGVPNDTTVFPLQKALAPHSDGNGIRVYGWLDPGVLLATSAHSTYPLTYNVDPNAVNLDQLILRFEKQPDTTQTDHSDWGFRASSLFGIDYRWTTAQGYASGQLLTHNQLYGYDPVEAYFMLYSPRLGQGTIIQFGRFISPPDIEAQLAPNNYCTRTRSSSISTRTPRPACWLRPSSATIGRCSTASTPATTRRRGIRASTSRPAK